MAGQGSPRTSRGRFARRWSGCRSLALALPVARLRLGRLVAVRCAPRPRPTTCGCASPGAASASGNGRMISVADGSVAEPVPLGVEADEPGSMWLDRNARPGALVVRQRSPRGYDGLDLLVSAPPTAKLLVQLSAADDTGQPAAVSVPLAEVAGDFLNKELDGRGNRLLVMRAPGDLLRVRLARQPGVPPPARR